jgi:CDGSH-type Zn-finger protein
MVPSEPTPLELPAGIHQLCGCGRSHHGPFCDGSHLGTGRVSYRLELSQATTVLICTCGASRRIPLCDGSHGRAGSRTTASRRSWWHFWA